MLRLLVIMPIAQDGLNNDVRREIEMLALPDVEITVTNLTSGPQFIENRYDNFKAHESLISMSLDASTTGYDGIYINVFTDSAVEIIRELIDIPILGGFKPALLSASAVAQKYSIITALPAVVGIYEDLTRALGLEKNMISIRNVNTAICNMKDRNNLIKHLFLESKETISEGAEAIILGCTGMLGVAQKLAELLHHEYSYYIPVINPTLSGVMMLYAMIKQKLSHSRITYSKVNIVP